MKLIPATLALGLAAVTVEGFTAQPTSFAARSVVQSTTEANLFGLRRKKKTAPETTDISEEEVRSFFSLWNNALATGDSKIVAKRYAEDAVLLPTVSDVPRTDYDGIKDYFDAFLQKQPQGEILSGNIKIGKGWAQDAGIYEFTMGATGDKVKGRYTYIYTPDEKGDWRIQHHHSSVLPEGIIGMGQPTNKFEVRGLFSLWNDALATLDSTTVANRYAKNAVLLPTVSDKPRTDYAGIKNYFDSFLTKKPQGTILEGEVMIGNNWAQDAGIYLFTLGATGDQVKARYSFVYVYEDGQWKIAHHHSSVMPEAVLPTPISKEEVRSLFGKWNDALATGDPKKVAARYTRDAVLLPTVSDTPRNSASTIEAYFVDFLKKEPQGVITEGEIKIGTNWAQDAGIYEFTMGADGSKVRARYSYVYAVEDGEWKIAHHHSSIMPEGALDALGKVASMEKEFA